MRSNIYSRIFSSNQSWTLIGATFCRVAGFSLFILFSSPHVLAQETVPVDQATVVAPTQEIPPPQVPNPAPATPVETTKPEKAKDAVKKDVEPAKLYTAGSLSTRYRFRSTKDINDNDLESIFSMDVGDPTADKYSGSVQGGGIFDLDGKQTGSPLASVYDGFASEKTERLYHAYVDAKDVQPFGLLRLGRQTRYEFESLYFDGLYAEWREAKGLTLITYGGVPVHLYETRLGEDYGDWLVGGALQLDPVDYVRFRFDYVQLNDSITAFRSTSNGTRNDGLMGASLWWDVTPNIMLSSTFKSFTDQVRNVDFQGRFNFPEQSLNIRVTAFSQLHSERIRVIDFDYYGFIGNYEPYVEGGFTFTKGLGDHFALDGGFFTRKLIEQQIASAFNHGYRRYFLTGSMNDLLVNGLSLAATGDYYNGTDNVLRDNILSGSFDAEQSLLERKLRFSAGTGYYLYKYNLLTGNESDNVRTYYVRLTAKLIKALEARVGYEYETSDLQNFNTVDTRVIWYF